VAASVIELKSVALSNTSSLPEPQKLVARLARSLDGISNASARASVFWLVGQFAAAEDKAVMGLGWEGVAPWVPDVLRKGIKGFSTEVGYSLRQSDVSAEESSRPLPSYRS
jgi:AP-3 complex subunit beta